MNFVFLLLKIGGIFEYGHIGGLFVQHITQVGVSIIDDLSWQLCITYFGFFAFLYTKISSIRFIIIFAYWLRFRIHFVGSGFLLLYQP